jgi:hypothetical protein
MTSTKGNNGKSDREYDNCAVQYKALNHSFLFEKLSPSHNKIYKLTLISNQDHLKWWFNNLGIFIALVSIIYYLLLKYFHRIHLIIWALLIIVSCIYLIYQFHCNRMYKESITVIQGQGIQMERYYYSLIPFVKPRAEKFFIHLSRIRALIINEGFHVNKVIYYMALIVNGENTLILPFKDLLPRMHLLLFIYRTCRHVLYNEPEPSTANLMNTLEKEALKHIVV